MDILKFRKESDQPSSYFVEGPFGIVEKDYRIIDNMIPMLGGYRHPNPSHWHSIRRQALKRDRKRCVTCNTKENIEAHHRTYARWGREELSDVYCLCSLCHQTFHEKDAA